MSVNLPVVNAPYLSVSGLEIAWATATTLTVAAGRARNSSNENDIILSSGVTINGAANGINGLDTGALANATLYTIYAVGDSSQNNTPGAVISASASQPTLPVGYDMYRAIGYVRTDGSAEFLLGYWSGSANERKFFYDAPIATAVTAGASTTDAAVTLTTFVPAVAGLPVWIKFAMTPAAASRILTLKPFGATGAVYQATSQVTAVVLTDTALIQAQLDSGAPKIEYVWSAGGGDAVAINVAGYEYTI
jgi:hypothetical protein